MSKLKIKDKQVFQSNYLTENYLPFTKIESDLFAVIIANLKTNVFSYNFEIKEILKILNISDNNYNDLLQALEGLSKKQIKFNYNAETLRQRITNVIDYIDYPINKIGINDKITIQLTQGIIPHLFNLKGNFTVYEIQSFLVLKSTYSKKLYTLFAQYKQPKTEYKIIKTAEEIQTLLGTNYRDFRVLMAKVIKPSIDEIMFKTNIENVVIEPIKTGRKITAYKFNFNWQKTQLEMALLPPLTNLQTLNQFDELLNKYKLTREQARIIIENVPPKEIGIIFNQITLQIVNHKVDNVGGYTLTIFKNKFKLQF